MKETIIKGTGNSRTLGSVPNLLTLYPTYEAFAAALAAGEVPVDIGPLNPAGVAQIGSPLNKSTLLRDETAALYGELPEDPTVDDTFALISDMIYRATTGKAKVKVSVKLADGTPVPDACINNLNTITGGNVFTDDAGVAVGYCNAGNIPISLKPHVDITSNTQTISAAAGKSYSANLVAATRNFASFSSSTTCFISGLAKRIDLSMAGGGAGGACGVNDALKLPSPGGGGGYVSTALNISFSTRTAYPLQVGAGGKGQTYNNSTDRSGAPGGSSSFAGRTVSGAPAYNGNDGTQPQGNGKGGYSNADKNGTNGTGTVFSSFTGTRAVGGGGGAGVNTSSEEARGKGGSPNGGNGSIYNSKGSAGSIPGGGGGGGCNGGGITSGNGENGGKGIVTFRIYF